MTTLYITEFSGLLAATGTEKALKGTFTPVAVLPGTTQTLALSRAGIVSSAASIASAAMSTRTRLVRLHALADCHIAIDRAATPADLRLTAGQAEYFGIAPSAVLQVLKA